ncbi:MAG TPA: helix-turn-helix transcriptional regulator [Alphaproteobacteria bacterium]|jgi:transcriptional regulator with XRE-family HTH domain
MRRPSFQTAEARRQALGDFLRAQRERLTPAQAGLAVGGRRRTPGLRREEVAQLSGVSATWYTWIEQGREVSASATALARLAEALHLTAAERAYLFDLAGKRDPEADEVAAASAPAVDLQTVVDMIGCPAYAMDRLGTARAWNRQAARLFVGWLDDGKGKRATKHDRNLLRYVFLEPAARKLIHDWEERARRVLAEFRADAGARLNDDDTKALIEELRGKSAIFARLWDEQAVLGREGGMRTFDHPEDGFLRYRQIGFTLAARHDLKLVMLVPET